MTAIDLKADNSALVRAAYTAMDQTYGPTNLPSGQVLQPIDNSGLGRLQPFETPAGWKVADSIEDSAWGGKVVIYKNEGTGQVMVVPMGTNGNGDEKGWLANFKDYGLSQWNSQTSDIELVPFKERVFGALNAAMTGATGLVVAGDSKGGALAQFIVNDLVRERGSQAFGQYSNLATLQNEQIGLVVRSSPGVQQGLGYDPNGDAYAGIQSHYVQVQAGQMTEVVSQLGGNYLANDGAVHVLSVDLALHQAQVAANESPYHYLHRLTQAGWDGLGEINGNFSAMPTEPRKTTEIGSIEDLARFWMTLGLEGPPSSNEEAGARMVAGAICGAVTSPLAVFGDLANGRFGWGTLFGIANTLLQLVPAVRYGEMGVCVAAQTNVAISRFDLGNRTPQQSDYDSLAFAVNSTGAPATQPETVKRLFGWTTTGGTYVADIDETTGSGTLYCRESNQKFNATISDQGVNWVEFDPATGIQRKNGAFSCTNTELQWRETTPAGQLLAEQQTKVSDFSTEVRGPDNTGIYYASDGMVAANITFSDTSKTYAYLDESGVLTGASRTEFNDGTVVNEDGQGNRMTTYPAQPRDSGTVRAVWNHADGTTETRLWNDTGATYDATGQKTAELIFDAISKTYAYINSEGQPTGATRQIFDDGTIIADNGINERVTNFLVPAGSSLASEVREYYRILADGTKEWVYSEVKHGDGSIDLVGENGEVFVTIEAGTLNFSDGTSVDLPEGAIWVSGVPEGAILSAGTDDGGQSAGVEIRMNGDTGIAYDKSGRPVATVTYTQTAFDGVRTTYAYLDPATGAATGIREVRFDNGAREILRPDGTGVIYGPGGGVASTVVVRNGVETRTLVDAYGRPTGATATLLPDGSLITDDGLGNRVGKYVGGPSDPEGQRTVWEFPDGTKEVRFPNDTGVIYGKNGEKTGDIVYGPGWKTTSFVDSRGNPTGVVETQDANGRTTIVYGEAAGGYIGTISTDPRTGEVEVGFSRPLDPTNADDLSRLLSQVPSVTQGDLAGLTFEPTTVRDGGDGWLTFENDSGQTYQVLRDNPTYAAVAVGADGSVTTLFRSGLTATYDAETDMVIVGSPSEGWTAVPANDFYGSPLETGDIAAFRESISSPTGPNGYSETLGVINSALGDMAAPLAPEDFVGPGVTLGSQFLASEQGELTQTMLNLGRQIEGAALDEDSPQDVSFGEASSRNEYADYFKSSPISLGGDLGDWLEWADEDDWSPVVEIPADDGDDAGSYMMNYQALKLNWSSNEQSAEGDALSSSVGNYVIQLGSFANASSEPRPACFAGETPVRMADGTEKAIATIRVGDEVAAFDGNGALVARRVTHLHVHDSAELVELADGLGHSVQVTAMHRFLTEEGEYKTVLRLHDGEPLLGWDGASRAGTSKRSIDGRHRVYNLTVDDLHTYVAGGFRVHNRKPVILDLDADNQVELLGLDESGAFFDMDEDGLAENVAWVNPDDGILAWDREGDGIIGEAREIVFDLFAPPGGTDMDGLRARFDTNGDGVLGAADAEFGSFGVWQDKDADGICDPGEFKSLTTLGITLIGLTPDRTVTSGNGYQILGTSAYIRADGTSGLAGDVDLSHEETPELTLVIDGSGRSHWEAADGTIVSRVEKSAAINVIDASKQGADLVFGAQGKDILFAGSGDGVTLFGKGGDDKLIGGDGDDTLDGGAGADSITGGGGNDVIYADSADRKIDGGAGIDEVHFLGSAGVTLDLAAAKVEKAYGGAGDDYLFTAGDGAVFLDGGAGDDRLEGGDASDFLSGGDGADILAGGAGDDDLAGGSGADTLTGGAGNDFLDGGMGQDVLDGGAGDDILVIDGEDDMTAIRGGAGYDTLQVAGSVGVTIDLGAAGVERAFGGDGNDRFVNEGGGALVADGGGGDDVLSGGNAADTLAGGMGSDILKGGFGDDAMDGGTGDDLLEGGAGNDVLVGGEGCDTFHGGDGDDLLVVDAADLAAGIDGGAGFDTVTVRDSLGTTLDFTAAQVEKVIGGDGDDILTHGGGTAIQMAGGMGADTLQGGSGSDTLKGDDGDDRLSGGKGADFMVGGAGDDVLDGGEGDDTLDGGAGSDRLVGGAGNDLLIIDAEDTVAGGAGYDVAMVADGAFADLDLGAAEIEKAIGAAGADRFRNSAGFAVEVLAGEGDDTLIGGGGADRLLGEAGADVIDGGDGADTLIGGTGDDRIQGGVGDDTLDGGAGSDVLEGGLGADLLIGGAGADRLDGGDGNDLLVIDAADLAAGLVAGGAGFDTATADGDAAIALDLGAHGIEAAIGGGGADFFTTTAAGFIQVKAGGGDDVVSGGAGADRLEGEAGNDRITGGDGADSLAGGTGDDVLAGDAGDDVLEGGAGADTLTGGSGDDLLQGGDGFDVAVFSGLAQDYKVQYALVAVPGTDQFRHTAVVTDLKHRDGIDAAIDVEQLQFADRTIDLTAPSKTPVAVDDRFRAYRETEIAIVGRNLTQNDWDLDAGHLDIVGVGAATGGQLYFNSRTQVVWFVPDEGYVGLASFEYTIRDAAGNEDTATAYVEVDPYKPVDLPADNLFGQQWHLFNAGFTGGRAGSDINVVSVWDDYTGDGIVIGSIEGGVDYNHSQIVANYDTLLDYDFVHGDNDAQTPFPTTDGHSTATTGFMVAARDGVGTVGVAYDASLFISAPGENGRASASLCTAARI